MKKKIFKGLTRDTLYKRCIMGQIAHAIMVPKFTLLSAAQSWDGMNYNFMDFEGIRGTISFAKDAYVCVIQNVEKLIKGEREILSKLLNGAAKEICELAASEALLYLMIQDDEGDISAATAAFWGDNENTYSNAEEDDLLEDSNNSLYPFLCSEEDAREYWMETYEMATAQAALMKKYISKN